MESVSFFEIILGLSIGALLYWWQGRGKNNAPDAPTEDDVPTGAKLFPILNPMKLRVDAKGDGHFGSSRTGHVHEGADFLCQKGQTVFAPINGVVVREGIAYSSDPRYKLVVLRGEGYDIKMMYCTTDKVGQRVRRGEPVAICQAISENMAHRCAIHVHLEVRQNGTLLDPEQCIDFTKV